MVMKDTLSYEKIIREIRPDIIVHGDKWRGKGREDLINDNPNVDSNNSLSFKKFEDVNSFFMNNSVKDRMKQIFEDADDIQGMMCENADKIKKDMFDRLPGHIRFDKNLNK